MRDLLLAVAARIALLLALGLNPLLISRCLLRKADVWSILAVAGLCCAAVNLIVPVALHVFAVPISTVSLTSAHWILALILLTAARLKKVSFCIGNSTPGRWLGLMLGAFSILVLPVTYLAGIDTYKWQDLATIVSVEQRIPWLVHPLSLFGFTPRSYPSAQPLLLATIQILGGLGVDWGFYMTSLVLGCTGTLTAFVLGREFFGADRGGLWTALLYTFSPVFMRYNHWATGRGMFVSLLPLFLLAVLRLPRLSATLMAIISSAFLALAHKTGVIAVPLIFFSLLSLAVVPTLTNRLWLIPPALLSLIGSLLLVPPIGPRPLGSIMGFVRYDVARFGWVTPLAVVGLFAAWPTLVRSPNRRLVPSMFLTFPLAHVADMYGALMALPFVTLVAVAGLMCIEERFPRHASVMVRVTAVLAFCTATGIVAYRGIRAAEKPVRVAAAFLDAHDPHGPYIIESPARDQIQGYVSGCPRFRVTVRRPLRWVFHALPRNCGGVRTAAVAWIAYLRNPLRIEGISTDWYGPNPRRYYVLINGKGTRPRDAVLLFKAEGVEIYEPAGQHSRK